MLVKVGLVPFLSSSFNLISFMLYATSSSPHRVLFSSSLPTCGHVHLLFFCVYLHQASESKHQVTIDVKALCATKEASQALVDAIVDAVGDLSL